MHQPGGTWPVSSSVTPGGPMDAQSQREEVKSCLPAILGLEMSREPAPLPTPLTTSGEPTLPSWVDSGTSHQGRRQAVDEAMF